MGEKLNTRIISHAEEIAPNERFVQDLKEDASETFLGLGRNPRTFDIAFSDAVTYALATPFIDPDANDPATWEAYVAAMQVGSALFTSVTTSDPTYCRIDGIMQKIEASAPASYATPGRWLTTFWLATICRDQDRLQSLSEIPISLLRASGVECDEYMYHWAETLQAFYKGDQSTAEKLTRTVRESHPNQVTIVDPDYLNKILYQPIQLVYQLLRGDASTFNEDLAQALIYHKEYWTSGDRNSESISSFIALGVLAIACIAHDTGVPVTVESHYIPKNLVEGYWVGHIET